MTDLLESRRSAWSTFYSVEYIIRNSYFWIRSSFMLYADILNVLSDVVSLLLFFLIAKKMVLFIIHSFVLKFFVFFRSTVLCSEKTDKSFRLFSSALSCSWILTYVYEKGETLNSIELPPCWFFTNAAACLAASDDFAPSPSAITCPAFRNL